MRWPYGGHLLYRGHLWMSPGRRACPLRRYLGVYTFRSVAKLQARHVQRERRRRPAAAPPRGWLPYMKVGIESESKVSICEDRVGG